MSSQAHNIKNFHKLLSLDEEKNEEIEIIEDDKRDDEQILGFIEENPSIENEEETDRKIITFYSRFKYLCNKYKIENVRKNHIDNFVKKFKSKCFKGIHEALKYCLNIVVNRLPQLFIINVKIEYNKYYLNKTIEEIYTEFKSLPSLKELIDNNLVKRNKKELLVLLMNSTLKDIYNIYLNSNLYKLEKIRLEKKSGKNFTKLFDFVSNNICEYFLYGKVNKQKINNSNEINNNNLIKVINQDKKTVIKFKVHKKLSREKI